MNNLKPTTIALLESFKARRIGWMPRYKRMSGEWAKNLRGECAWSLKDNRRLMGNYRARQHEINALGYRQHMIAIGKATFV